MMSEAALAFSEEEIQVMLDNLDHYSTDEVAEIDRMVDELSVRKENSLAYDDLIEFCKRMQPDYIVGKHHRLLANMLMGIERGEKDRICVNIPPRHGKSQLVSIFFPAWFLGRNPNKKVMMVSHTTDLAVDFGRKVRNLIATDDLREKLRSKLAKLVNPEEEIENAVIIDGEPVNVNEELGIDDSDEGFDDE